MTLAAVMGKRTAPSVAEQRTKEIPGSKEVKWRFWSNFVRQKVWNPNHKINSETRDQPISF